MWFQISLFTLKALKKIIPIGKIIITLNNKLNINHTFIYLKFLKI